jgi:hypothetical protein
MFANSNNSTPTSSTSSMKTASLQSNQHQVKTKRSLSINTVSSSATSSTSSSCSIQTEKRKSLVPSPTLYMVSLAEAEIDDDDEDDELFDDGQKVKKKSNALTSISNTNENEINSKHIHDHLSDDVEYVDEDTNSDKSAKFDESIEEANNLEVKPATSTENSNQESTDVLRNFLDEKEDNSNSTLSGIENSLVFKHLNGLNSISNNSASLQSSSSSSTTSSATSVPIAKLLTPDERISNEVREYWATIDLYNNSKMAFNKRCKSVKLKREKLNAEIKKRYSEQSHVKPAESISSTATSEAINFETNTNNSSLCTCVKCSIAYHEAKIKGITDVNEIICSKCSNKLLICKCCSFHSSSNSLDTNSSTTAPSSIATSSSTSNSIVNNSQISNLKVSIQTPVSTTPTNTQVCPASPKSSSELQPQTNLNNKKTTNNGFVQFEEKLFNIKNELV